MLTAGGRELFPVVMGLMRWGDAHLSPQGAPAVVRHAGCGGTIDAPARVLMWSTVVHPAVTVYPDSGKVGVYTRGGEDDLIVERASGVDYYAGEEGPPG